MTANRRRATAPAPAPDDLVLDDTADDPIVLSAADRLALALDASADDAKAEVRIYKQDDDERFQWCETLAPEAYERSGYAPLRSKWGPGVFRIMLYGTTEGKAGKPGFGIRAQETVKIAEDRSAIAPAAAPVSSDMQRTLDAIVETQRTIAAALTIRPEPVDQVAQMTQFLGLMKLMREATGDDHPRRGGGSEVMEVLKAMRELKATSADIFGDATPQAEPTDPLTAALPQLLELVKTAGQRTPPATDLVAPVTLPASMSPPGGAAGAADHHQAQEADTMPVIDDAQQLMSELTRKLHAVVALAAADMDPEQGADIVFEHLPDQFLGMLREPTWFEAVCHFAPHATPYRAWLDQARQIVLRWMQEEAEQQALEASQQQGGATIIAPAETPAELGGVLFPAPAPAPAKKAGKSAKA